MKKTLKSAVALILVFLFMAAQTVVFAENEKTVKTDVINQKFESFETSERMGAFPAIGQSYGTGLGQITKDGAIKGKSLRASSCDLRWWSLGYIEREYHFAFDFKIDENYDGTSFIICVSTQDAKTTSEGTNGQIMGVMGAADGAYFTSRGSSGKLFDIEKDKVYSVEAVMYYGSDTYSIYCNGELLSDSCQFVSEIYAMTGLRINATGKKQSYVVIDTLHIFVEGRAYAQKLSYQEPGDIPEIVLPAEKEDYGTEFWFNNTELTPAVKPVKDEENGTYYVPLKATLEALGYTVAETEKDGAAIIKTDSFKITPSENGIVKDGKLITLTTPFKTAEDGTVLAPAQFFSEVLDCKVWYDEYHDMLVYSNGKYKDDGILRVLGSIFYMNGEPYYEISFNKFDLYWQIAGDAQFNGGKYPNRDFPNAKATLEAAEEALSQLHENGFKTIRVFFECINMNRKQEDIDLYFSKNDLLFDLCDKYDIKVVVCMGLLSSELVNSKYNGAGEWVTVGDESFYELLTDENSKSRQNLYDFLKAYAERYKDRKTVLMWEVNNEGNLGADIGYTTGVITYSALQLGNYYAAVGKCLHEVDPDHLVTSGDSVLRTAQWHLFAGTMKGRSSSDWTVDNATERLNILWILNHGLDVISVHAYGAGMTKMSKISWYNEEGARLGRGLYDGETNGQLAENGKRVTSYVNTDPKLPAAAQRYLEQKIIADGAQLTHWWAFHSDRRTQGNDVDTWSVRTDDKTAELFKVIVEANKKLQETYIVNGIEGEAQGKAVITDAPEEPEETGGGNTAVIIAVIAAAAVLICAIVLIVIRSKKKKA